nr:NADH dehydrogenase subunit 4L [Ovalona pulchella]
MTIFSSLSLMVLISSVFVFLFTFVSGRNHLLGTLLSLEGLMLTFFGVFCWINGLILQYNYYILIFLTFVACEGALALSLLVVVVRWWGGDQLMALGMLQGN